MIIVGADKGGVGKTTVTRVLSEYLAKHETHCKYFDTEFPSGDLKRFIPSARVIDISRVTSQMEVFDTLDNDVVTVIDLRAGMLSTILVELDNALLLEDVRAGRMELDLLHILGPTVSSLGEIVTAAEKIGGGAKHILVKNYINDSTFFDWDKDQENSPLRRMSDLTITIPQLTEIAAEQVQKQACSFQAFVDDQHNSRILRGRVIHWLEAIYKEFDRIDISHRENL